MSPVILLDRDGVINEDSDLYIKSPDEWRPIPGSLEAIALLGQRGVKVMVLTNQSGIARGLFERATLEQIHARMRLAVQALGGRIDDIFFCPHGPDEGCSCRKPRPGLFQQAADKYRLDLNNVPAVGDSYRDLEAALAVGARPILVKTGKGERTLAQHPDLSFPVYPDLYAAVQSLQF
mgnify:CR=1 FL=1